MNEVADAQPLAVIVPGVGENSAMCIDFHRHIVLADGDDELSIFGFQCVHFSQLSEKPHRCGPMLACVHQPGHFSWKRTKSEWLLIPLHQSTSEGR